MTREARRIPEFLLERYLTDSLDAAERARIEASLTESPQDRARLEELRADAAAFLIRHPPGPLVARFREQQQRRGRWWRWPTLLVEVLAVGTAALLMFSVLSPQTRESWLQFLRGEPEFTVKGSVILVVYRKEGDTGVPVANDGHVAPGDTLRFQVKAEASGFVAVLSRDGRGTVSVYAPFNGEAAAAYDASQPLLPGAIQLDDTLGPEDVYALYSTQPFELAWAVEALRQGRLLEAAASRRVSAGHASFVKGSPP